MGELSPLITILVVEDHKVFVDILKQRLSQELGEDDYFFSIITASNYKEMSDILTQAIVDMVLLDLKLPDIEWTDTIKFFKRDFPLQPFCIMSSLTSKAYAIYSLQEGAEDYFMKHDRRINIKERLAFAYARSLFRKGCE